MKVVYNLTQFRGKEDWQFEVGEFLEGWNAWIPWKSKANPDYFMGKEISFSQKKHFSHSINGQ